MAEVLDGTRRYDNARPEAQALVRAASEQRIAERLAARDYLGALVEPGQPCAEADRDGRLVWRERGARSGAAVDAGR